LTQTPGSAVPTSTRPWSGSARSSASAGGMPTPCTTPPSRVPTSARSTTSTRVPPARTASPPWPGLRVTGPPG